MSILACALPELNTDRQPFVQTLGGWGLPVEETVWGGYVDLSGIAPSSAEVKALGRELGRTVRDALDRPPAVGGAAHKFTALMAAVHTHPGHLRVVDPTDERAFLAPLSVDMLPLPLEDVQRLYWLGIRTLGQFAALPVAGVWERFGPAGKLAQRWARGQDDRPVRAGPQPLPPPVEVDLDPPTELWPLALADLLATLNPIRQRLAEQFLGICRLGLTLTFVDGSAQSLDLRRVEPVSDGEALKMWIDHSASNLAWPGEVTQITAAILAVGELSAPQLTLFPLDDKPPITLAELADPLATRYGAIFHQAQISDPSHPLPCARFHFFPIPDPVP